MSESLLQFGQAVINGLSTGSVYAIVALALVLIFRATKVLNFAQGQMITFTTYLDWTLLQYGVPFWLAFALSLPAAALFGLLVERLVIRPVEDKPELNGLIVSLGLLAVLSSLTGMIWGVDYQGFPSPFSGPGLQLFGTGLSRQNLGTIGLTVALMLATYVIFQHTRLGLAMRATAANQAVSRLLGIRVGRMLAAGWMLSTVVGAVAGILLAPVVFLRPTMMDDAFVFGFAAAVLGGMESLPGSVVGGLLVGIIYELAGTYLGPELQLFSALVILVLILMARPRGLFGRRPVRAV